MGFVSHSYSKSTADITKHVKYISNRERYGEGEERGLFSEHDDRASRTEFLKKVDNPINHHSQAVKAHKLLFSMSGDEWERSQFSPGDYQRVIRNVMKEWEIQKGIRVDWIAAEHRTEGHPHVHVVVAGFYKDRDGIEHRLKITNEDRKFLKQEFDCAKTRIRGFELPTREERMQERNFYPKFNLERDITDAFFREVERRMYEEEMEREQVTRSR
ncbi:MULTISPECIES: hypothetical protein [Bacillus]|uniref:hypothetical protein n=1 Tax=Bacillus TaxID=1386 RepID=UPI001BB3B926|nr:MULTISPECIES: hypothetical protein [Bacillus]BCC80208.1 hypothetical protein BCJMU62_p217 [Bacillus cereus]GMB79173.1 hypothetical protein BCER1_55740 [Bacillus cereus]